MSEFVECRTCRKGSGFVDRYRSKICPACHGTGRSKKRQRGFHEGDNWDKVGTGSQFICAQGHIKTGIGVDNNGNLRTFCSICHNRVTNETKRRRKEKVK